MLLLQMSLRINYIPYVQNWQWKNTKYISLITHTDQFTLLEDYCSALAKHYVMSSVAHKELYRSLRK